MRVRDLRGESEDYPHADAAAVPRDMRGLFCWCQCGHGLPLYASCPECEVIRTRDRALAWGITAGTLAVLAWGAVLVMLLHWVGG